MISVETIEENGERVQQVEIDCDDTAYLYYDLMSIIRSVFDRVGYSEEFVLEMHKMVDEEVLQNMDFIQS